MPKVSDGRLALGLLAGGAIWLFAVLPFLYGPPPRFAESGGPPQTHTDQTAQQPTAKPDGSVTAPFFIRIPKTAKEETEEADDRREKSSTDRWLMIFTGAVALFTLLLVGATVMLYFAGERQLRLASETSKRQSDEMEKSIAVAENSADIARHAMVAGQRAFVFPVSLVPEWLIGDQPGHYNWQFRPMWRNSGDTPTRNMTMHAGYELRDTPLPDNFDFDYPTTEIGSALIPPKTEYAGGMAPRGPDKITPSDIAAVQSGIKFMFFWGWAKYFDVFPETPARVTRFCWQVIPMGDPFAFRPGAPQNHQSLRFPYVYNHKGNCADDDCQ
jgi:hypothetical protein